MFCLKKPIARALRAKPTLAVTPLVITDQTSFAVVGLDDRQFRDLVKQHGIPSRVVGRRLLVLARDLETFVRKTIAEAPDAPSDMGAALEDADRILAKIGKRRHHA